MTTVSYTFTTVGLDLLVDLREAVFETEQALLADVRALWTHTTDDVWPQSFAAARDQADEYKAHLEVAQAENRRKDAERLDALVRFTERLTTFYGGAYLQPYVLLDLLQCV